jgi:anti-sigma regulatory factor (Ser/Thr protein kinase)
MNPERHAELRLLPGPSAPGRARDFLIAACRAWAVPEFLETGALVVSELVTNAVQHAGTAIRVVISLVDSVLTVFVYDSGAGEPRLIPPQDRTVGGRGLAMVAKVSQAWGVQAEPNGKSVWCRLSPP